MRKEGYQYQVNDILYLSKLTSMRKQRIWEDN